MTQKEIFKHLSDGGKIINKFKAIVGFKENKLFNYTTKKFENWCFDNIFHDWQIYEEQKWYENIPEFGRLGKDIYNNITRLFVFYDGKYVLDCQKDAFYPENIILLTNEEIKQFMVQDEK